MGDAESKAGPAGSNVQMSASNGDTGDRFLAPRTANFVPLSPIDFLRRAAVAHPNRTAVVYNETRTSYAEFAARCRRLASALRQAGVQTGDTVAVMAPNIPALLEAHYGVPLAGAVLNAINVRLDPASIRFGLAHGGAKVLFADRDYASVVRDALSGLADPPLVIDIIDPAGRDGHSASMAIGAHDYETFLSGGDPEFPWALPADEWQSIALNYTSGTTGDPKGVLYHHRGAYLNAFSNALAFGLGSATRYLWTVPMFHCNGWCFTWAVTLAGGTHVCLRLIDPARIFDLIAAEHVTLFSAAPIVLNMLIHAREKPQAPFGHKVEIITGGAAPPSIVIEAIEAMGFTLTHAYGLTETYGPATVCAWQEEWDALDAPARAAKMARQGVLLPAQHEVTVFEPGSVVRVPWDGATQGEIAVRGNTVMKGYLKNRAGTEAAFQDGWFRSGDVAVVHPDGYIDIKDRLKDIIISGGENISSLEVENVLYRHPHVLEAAVVAKTDGTWGETPCAFVTLKDGAPSLSSSDIIAWCRAHLAAFKAPRHVVFSDLPKTPTGKIQKFELRQRANQL